jgi:hypothetical protein
VTLQAGQSYYIFSSETAGADSWYNDAPVTILDSSIATIVGAAHQPNCTGTPLQFNTGNYSYVPVSFTYANQNISPQVGFGVGIGGVPLAISPFTGEVRVNYGITFGAGQATAFNLEHYGNIDTYSSGNDIFIADFPRINMGDGQALGNHNALVFGSNFIGDGSVPNPFGWTAMSTNVAPAFGFLRIGTTVNGEASIMFGDSMTNFSASPPTSSQGTPAIWYMGENNQAMAAGANNHIFFVSNNNASGPNGPVLQISPSSGNVRITDSLQFGFGSLSAFGQDVYANIDAFGSQPPNLPRINMGAGTPGNAAASVFLGSITLTGGSCAGCSSANWWIGHGGWGGLNTLAMYGAAGGGVEIGVGGTVALGINASNLVVANTLYAPTSFAADGTMYYQGHLGISATATVIKTATLSGGVLSTTTCTLTFSGGLVTGSTC